MKKILLLMAATLVSCAQLGIGKAEKQLIPLLLGGETISRAESGIATNPGEFWVGIVNNVFTAGNTGTGFSKDFNSVGSVSSAALAFDCQNAYLQQAGGIYRYNLFTGAYSFLQSNQGAMSASPNGTKIAFGYSNNLYFIDTVTNVVSLVHTFGMQVRYVSFKTADVLYVALLDGPGIYHIYEVPIADWTTTRLTQSAALNVEYLHAYDSSDARHYFIGDVGGGTSNNLFVSSDLVSFSQIDLNVARNLLADARGQAYVAQGVINGSTEMRLESGQLQPQSNLPVGNVTIMDFCRWSNQSLFE